MGPTAPSIIIIRQCPVYYAAACQTALRPTSRDNRRTGEGMWNGEQTIVGTRPFLSSALVFPDSPMPPDYDSVANCAIAGGSMPNDTPSLCSPLQEVWGFPVWPLIE